MKLLLSSFVLLIFSFFSTATFAVSKVTLSDVHICCSTCQETIQHAVLESKGPTSKLTKMLKTVAISAGDDTVVQEALDAVASAGFYGKSDNAKVGMKTTALDGKLSSAEFVGFHNCCGGCSSSIENAVKSVIGVQAATVSNRSCLVKGDFNVVSVVKAINDAGFSASVKK